MSGEKMKEPFRDKTVLITGGTGTIGRGLIEKLLAFKPEVVRVIDSSENALFNLHQEYGNRGDIRYFLGDIRDRDRLQRAMEDVDIVFHTAALKHVFLCEYNPFEAVKTNVIGTQNVIKSALYNKVDKVIFTSSDKAVNPGNTMGASKLLAEKLIVSANYYKGTSGTRFSAVRFGNVMGSSGSVIPTFLDQIKQKKPLTITHTDMTRFVISQNEALDLLIEATQLTQGGEIFIMKMPVVNIQDLAEAMFGLISTGGKNRMKTKIVGAKAGEKLYEELTTEEETARTLETENLYIVLPYKEIRQQIDVEGYPVIKTAKDVAYRSDNVQSLSIESIKDLLIEKGIVNLAED